VKTIGLIQARMGSMRLPGKVMRPLAGRPLVWHIMDRLRRVEGLSQVVLATTAASENDPMAQWATGEGLTVVRHPIEDDVAGRLAMAVDATCADAMVKVNADCPLADPEVMSSALALLRSDPKADGATNKLKATYPLGLSVELLRRDTILWCDRNLKSAQERELTVKWIFDHPERFRILSQEAEKNESRFNLTVDTPADYALMSDIFDNLFVEGQTFGWGDARAYLAGRASVPSCAFLEPVNAR
jgi:spore coat polysaccharide biosynthesis protein SpsF